MRTTVTDRPSSSGNQPGVDAPRDDVDALLEPAVHAPGDPLEHTGPHVQLGLLGHRHVIVHHVGEAIAGARPGLDLEDQRVILVTGAPLDLARFEMPVERQEAKRARRDLGYADGTVPGRRHADHEHVVDPHLALVADLLLEMREPARRDPVRIGSDRLHQRAGLHLGAVDPGAVATPEERSHAVLDALDVLPADRRSDVRGSVGGPLARDLAPPQRRGPPHVAPGGQQHADGPAQGNGETTHGLLLPMGRDLDVPKPSAALHTTSLASIGLCIVLWIRAKTVSQEERGNAERRALFVGLWPPMFWLLGDAAERRERHRVARWFTR